MRSWPYTQPLPAAACRAHDTTRARQLPGLGDRLVKGRGSTQVGKHGAEGAQSKVWARRVCLLRCTQKEKCLVPLTPIFFQ